MDIFWLDITILIFSLSALLSALSVIAYIPVKKSPAALKTILSLYTQRFYTLLVFSLFSALLSLGLYITVAYDLLIIKNINEIGRLIAMTAFTVSLLLSLLSFKKQKLSDLKIFFHLFFSSLIIVIISNDDIFHASRYY